MTDMKVTLARPWKDAEGKEHAPDTTVTVPLEQGEEMLWYGYARPADDTKKKG